MKKIIIIGLCLVSFFSCRKEALQEVTAAPGQPSDNFQIHTFEIDANSGERLLTNVSVEEDDFVFVEVLGEIKLGTIAGYGFGDGSFCCSNYNKYNYSHGSLVTLLKDKTYGIQNIDFIGNPIFFQMVDERKLTDEGYLPCSYFFAETEGEIIFDINDVDHSNNSGSFTINLYVLKSKGHTGRNTFNRCPRKEPIPEVCYEDERWVNDGLKGWFYHGAFHDVYRGTGKNKGCQCVYENGDLVIAHNDQGTFDYGFWDFEGQIEKVEAIHLHLILDVIPHVLRQSSVVNDRKTKIYNNPERFCE